MSVRHLHRLSCFSYRTVFADLFKENDTAVSKIGALIAINPDAAAESRGWFQVPSMLFFLIHIRNIIQGIAQSKKIFKLLNSKGHYTNNRELSDQTVVSLLFISARFNA